jgi:hypothetical protein
MVAGTSIDTLEQHARAVHIARIQGGRSMTRSIRGLALAVMATLVFSGLSLAAPAKMKSAVGTLQKVDGQMLTIKTPSGDEMIMLTPAVKIRSRSKSVAASDLSAHIGDRVKVRYTETNGRKDASMVTLSSNTTKTARVSRGAKPHRTAKKS